MTGASDRSTARSSRGSASSANFGLASALLSPDARLPLLAALCLLLSVAASCGADPTHSAPPIGQGGASGTTGTGPSMTDATCTTEGATRACHVTLGQHGGVLSCFVGIQTCSNGRFGECTDGSVSNFTMPPDGSELRSLSIAGPCTSDPCDPTCRLFDETPLGGAVISLAPWNAGSLANLQKNPAGSINTGIKSPCSTAGDCQFNEYCQDPDASKCAHHKCATGAALDPSCDACVKQICAVDPTCCSDTWSQGCVDKVHDVCGAFCSSSVPQCAHDLCFTGDPLDAACDKACVEQVCASNKACCSSDWDSSCVADAASVCGKACPTQGVCKPWFPGETDQRCSGVDLTVGIPCSSTATDTDLIAICNVGTQNAPAGLQVVAYDSGAGFSGPLADLCAPTGAIKVKCGATAGPIPPGGCINMPCAGLSGGEEIIVNPPDPSQVPECQCRNNWTIFSVGIPCELSGCPSAQPTCQATNNTQTYTNNCPPGTKVQWGFLGWNTTTPTNTSVIFEARTADTAAGLASATYRLLGTAKTSPTDTHLCPIGSSCQIDLFKQFNGPPDAMRDYLELSVTLKQNLSAGQSSTVNNWQLTYSCPPAE
jgi:hypothetical protein